MLIHFEKLAYDLFPRVVNRLLTKLALLIVPYVSLQFIRLFSLLPIALRGEANRLPFVFSIRSAVAAELSITIADVAVRSNNNSFVLSIARTLTEDRINDIRQLVEGYRLAGTRAVISTL